MAMASDEYTGKRAAIIARIAPWPRHAPRLLTFSVPVAA
jgi:hypothetical protein